jgi:hypothetical protein
MCLEALLNSNIESVADIVIFVDGPHEKDLDQISRVREFVVNTSLSFQFVSFVFNETNKGSKSQAEFSLEYVRAKSYWKYVMLEEDVIVGKNFIGYMDRCLNEFKFDNDIISICGFTHSIFTLGKTPKTRYLSHRFSPWGFGSWIDTDLLNLKMSDLELFFQLGKKDNLKKIKFSGLDILPNIYYAVIMNKPISNDYRVILNSVCNKLYHLYPNVSLTYNIGLDGSGENCKITRLNYQYPVLDNVPVDLISYVEFTPEYDATFNYRRYIFNVILSNKVVFWLFYFVIRRFALYNN